MLKMPLSRIGPIQLIDVEHSGGELHDEFFRTCTVLQGDPPTSAINDDVPLRIASMYGGFGTDWRKWNEHFVVQVAGCPLRCWYCYVDNFKPDKEFTVVELVYAYAEFRKQNPSINVFHLMGGCPGKYAYMWPYLRNALDTLGFEDTVLLTDVVLVEDHLYGTKPWMHIPRRTVVSVCLKGTDFRNFEKNTGFNGFAIAIRELWGYRDRPEVYYTMVEWDPKDKPYIEEFLGRENINWLVVKEYEVVKRRLQEEGGPKDWMTKHLG